MKFSKDSEKLLPMKFVVGDPVTFRAFDGIKKGVIEIADFGGSLDNDYHSYDILVDSENTLYKHVSERDISRIKK